MNVFDIVIAVLLIIGFVRGLMKGLFVEVASLVALIGGVYGAIHFSYFAIDFLGEKLSWDEEYIKIAGFALTFLLIVLLILLIGKLLTKLAGMIALGIVNRILGGIFGLIKFAFVLSVIVMFLTNLNKNITFLDEGHFKTSILLKPIKKVAPIVLPPVLEGFEETNDKLNA